MKNIEKLFESYQNSFTQKQYSEENNDIDILMSVFQITPELKRENRQYWGRELGMLWERLIQELFREYHADYKEKVRIDRSESCDLYAGHQAIDTKYRLGSGDSGTLKKLKANGEKLLAEGYQPILLVLREDNLQSALSACKAGGWKVLTGQESLRYIQEKTGVQLVDLLHDFGNKYDIKRTPSFQNYLPVAQ